jgi:hypothetical protein
MEEAMVFCSSKNPQAIRLISRIKQRLPSTSCVLSRNQLEAALTEAGVSKVAASVYVSGMLIHAEYIRCTIQSMKPPFVWDFFNVFFKRPDILRGSNESATSDLFSHFILYIPPSINCVSIHIKEALQVKTVASSETLGIHPLPQSFVRSELNLQTPDRTPPSTPPSSSDVALQVIQSFLQAEEDQMSSSSDLLQVVDCIRHKGDKWLPFAKHAQNSFTYVLQGINDNQELYFHHALSEFICFCFLKQFFDALLCLKGIMREKAAGAFSFIIKSDLVTAFSHAFKGHPFSFLDSTGLNQCECLPELKCLFDSFLNQCVDVHEESKHHNLHLATQPANVSAIENSSSSASIRIHDVASSIQARQDQSLTLYSLTLWYFQTYYILHKKLIGIKLF